MNNTIKPITFIRIASSRCCHVCRTLPLVLYIQLFGCQAAQIQGPNSQAVQVGGDWIFRQCCFRYYLQFCPSC